MHCWEAARMMLGGWEAAGRLQAGGCWEGVGDWEAVGSFEDIIPKICN